MAVWDNKGPQSRWPQNLAQRTAFPKCTAMLKFFPFSHPLVLCSLGPEKGRGNGVAWSELSSARFSNPVSMAVAFSDAAP